MGVRGESVSEIDMGKQILKKKEESEGGRGQK